MGIERYSDDEDIDDQREKIDDRVEALSEVKPNYSVNDVYSDVKVKGDANDVKRINEAMDELEKSEVGKGISNEIKGNDASIEFGDINAVAQYDPSKNEITINESLRDSDPTVLAAHLAHEGTHVQWYGQGIPDSIDQEYHAFKNEKEVWDDIKGDKVDDQCDWVSAMIEQGEADAKMEIRLRYPYLKEYA